MIFVKRIYEIFHETSDKQERINQIRKYYEEDHKDINKEIMESKWETIIPLLKEMSSLEFKVNNMIDCIAKNTKIIHELFVHLEKELFHNKEMITFLLAIYNIWSEGIEEKTFPLHVEHHLPICSFENLSTIEKYIGNCSSEIDYDGNLISDIRQAYSKCRYPYSIREEMKEKRYYHYLQIECMSGLGSNNEGSPIQTTMQLRKVIVI